MFSSNGPDPFIKTGHVCINPRTIFLRAPFTPRHQSGKLVFAMIFANQRTSRVSSTCIYASWKIFCFIFPISRLIDYLLSDQHKAYYLESADIGLHKCHVFCMFPMIRLVQLPTLKQRMVDLVCEDRGIPIRKPHTKFRLGVNRAVNTLVSFLH